MRTRHLLAILALAPLATGCIASNVLGVQDRAVQLDETPLDWRAPERAELVGLWRTTAISGPAAAVLLDLTYWLDDDGTFSGAALFAGPPPAYETLSGTWRFGADGTLQLGEDVEPATVELAADVLRLRGTDGVLTFERAELR
jgi:hypothetical protein